MHVMCCRRHIPYITYTEAVGEVLRDNMKCCFWISYVFQFSLAVFIAQFHCNIICCDFVHAVNLIEKKINLNINNSTIILKSIIFIPFLLMFSIQKLQSLAFLSIMSSVAFCLCE